MILNRRYTNTGVYAMFNYKLYQLVFEHNFSISKCFTDTAEAKNSDKDGKFSILYDLNNTKYLMKDNFRHYILEYPELQLINAWKQTLSPTEEPEVERKYQATGFHPKITESPMKGWGGLVKTTLPEAIKRVPTTYLDGNPGNNTWWYSVGMLCNFPEMYDDKGVPASDQVKTKQVCLWSAIRESYCDFAKYSCICSFYNSLTFVLMSYLFICS